MSLQISCENMWHKVVSKWASQDTGYPAVNKITASWSKLLHVSSCLSNASNTVIQSVG